jgi:hypothetical protein
VPIFRIKSGRVLIVGGNIDGMDSPAIQAPFDDAPGTLTLRGSTLGATRYDSGGGELSYAASIVNVSKANNVSASRGVVTLDSVLFDPSVEAHGGASIRIGSSDYPLLTETALGFSEGGVGTPSTVIFEDFPTLISPRFKPSGIQAFRPASIVISSAIQAKFNPSTLLTAQPTVTAVQLVGARFRASSIQTFRPTITSQQVVVAKFRPSGIQAYRPTLTAVQRITAKFRSSSIVTRRPTVSVSIQARFRASGIQTFRPTLIRAGLLVVARFYPSTARALRPVVTAVQPIRARYRTSSVATFRPSVTALQPIRARFQTSSLVMPRPLVTAVQPIHARFRTSSIVTRRPASITVVDPGIPILAKPAAGSSIRTFRPTVFSFHSVVARFRPSSIVTIFWPTVSGGVPTGVSDAFGVIVDESVIEDMLVAQLKGWFPPTLAEVYRQAGINDFRSHSAVSWQRFDIVDRWPLGTLPSVLVSVSSAPSWQRGADTWSAVFRAEVSCIVQSGGSVDGRRLAQRTAASLRAGLSMRSFADWADIRIVSSDIGSRGEPASRTVWIATVTVDVYAADVQKRYSSLIDPPPTHIAPAPETTAETVTVTVIPEEA